MPTVGSKELVAWLPLLLGLGAGDLVVRPLVAYPTYDIGAQLAGADSIAADSLAGLSDADRARVKLVWVNSPGNPTGIIRGAAELKALVDDARSLGAVVASDECYAELGWGEHEAGVPSILHESVSGGDFTDLLSVYSLSKQSNLAGYRAAFVAGAPNLMPALVNNRKHAGMIVPAPGAVRHGGGPGRRRARQGAKRQVPGTSRGRWFRRWGPSGCASWTRWAACTCGAPRTRIAGAPWPACRARHRCRARRLLRRRRRTNSCASRSPRATNGSAAQLRGSMRHPETQK